METLKLNLVTPFKKVFEGVEVTEVKVPSEKGQLTIYPDHSPLVTTLGTGILSYLEKGKTEPKKAVITWGYCEIMDGTIKLLAEGVTTKEQVDLSLSEKVKKEAEEKLASNTLEPEQIKEYQNKLKKAQAELEL